MQEISINNNDVGGYKYNAAVTLIKQINCVLEQQLFEESADGMVGLGRKTPNNLTSYQSTVAIKKNNFKKQSISGATMLPVKLAACASAINFFLTLFFLMATLDR